MIYILFISDLKAGSVVNSLLFLNETKAKVFGLRLRRSAQRLVILYYTLESHDQNKPMIGEHARSL